FEAHFGDIVARGGFDIVVGNPPWVRGERLAPQVREALTTRYAAWRPEPPWLRAPSRSRRGVRRARPGARRSGRRGRAARPREARLVRLRRTAAAAPGARDADRARGTRRGSGSGVRGG